MNRLSKEKRAFILHLLVEGNSIRGAGRLADVDKETIMKLLTDVGAACAEYQDKKFTNLPCKRVEVDEIYSFVHARAKNAPEGVEGVGAVWTWTSICVDTKLVPCWMVGGRDTETAQAFLDDLAPRMANRIQLTSDGLKAYKEAVDTAFGKEVDFGMLVKQYGEARGKKFGPYQGAIKERITGSPDMDKLTTAHVERQNLTMRMSIRRFARKTNAFSKRIYNHECAIALHFMYYNFCRIHKSLRVTPAMAAGVTDKILSLEELVEI